MIRSGLKALELENFKAFGERVRVPIAPITLIFGENSAGKSSILQSLLLLKQSVDSGVTGAPIVPRIDGGVVDLGSFQDLLFDHDPGNMLGFSLEFEMFEDGPFGFMDRRVWYKSNYGFKRPNISHPVSLERWSIDHRQYGRVATFDSRKKLPELPATRRMLARGDFSGFARCTSVTKDPGFWAEVLGRSADRIHSDTRRPDEDEIQRQRELAQHVWVLFKSLLPAGTLEAGDQGTELLDLIDWIDWQTRSALNDIRPIGPYRKPPLRWYIHSGRAPSDVGPDAEYLADLLLAHEDVRRDVNVWFERLGLGYELRVERTGDRLRDLFEIRLADVRRDEPIEVSLADVGFGISQILPIVVQAMATEHKLITIEQPEVHVHPRLQSDLGDLLIAATKKPHFNSFLIETHSEHLILRLLRRIRETTDGKISDDTLKLYPESLCVLYVSRGKHGSSVLRIPVTEDGKFGIDWPGGFFAERLGELL